MFDSVSVGYKKFKEMDESIRGSGSSFSDYIRWTSKSEDATEAFGLATAYTKFRVIALNMALSAGIGLVVSYFSKKIIEAAQRVDKLAESSKEAADAATSTTSSLSELVDEYEKLGKKSDWDTDDMEQAQKIQDEILQLAKEQGTLDEDRAKKIDLQNGKYEEQLGLLREISGEQIRASSEDYEDNADKQGRKLVKDAKKTINTGYVLTSSTDHKMAEDLQTQGFDIFKGVAANALVLGPKNKNDPESVVEYYNQISEALKYLKENYDKADLESKGIYEGLYNILADQKDALEDQVKAYNDSTNAISENELALRNWETYLALTNTNARAVKGAVGTLADSIEGFNADKLIDLLNGNGLDGLNSTQIAALDKIREFMTLKDYSTDQIESFVNVLTQVGVVAPSAAEKAQDLAQRTKDAATQMSEAASSASDLQKAYQSCKSAVEEYNKTGYVSFSTLQSLTAMEPKYLSMLENSNGKLEINTATTKKLTQAMIEAQKAAILAQTLTDIENTTTLDAAKNYLSSAQATVKDAKSLILAQEIDSAKQAYINGGMEAYHAVRLANAKRRENAELKMDLWDKLGLQDPDDIFGKDSKSNNSSKTQKNALDAWSTLTSAMKEYNQQGYITMQTLKSLTDLEDKYSMMLKKNDTTGQLEMRTDLFYALIKAELKEAQIKGDGASEAQYNKILEWTDRNIQKQTMSYWDLVAAIEGYSSALSEAKGITDGFKDA